MHLHFHLCHLYNSMIFEMLDFPYFACQSVIGKLLFDITPSVLEDLPVFSGEDGELLLGALLWGLARTIPRLGFLVEDSLMLKLVERVSEL